MFFLSLKVLGKSFNFVIGKMYESCTLVCLILSPDSSSASDELLFDLFHVVA